MTLSIKVSGRTSRVTSASKGAVWVHSFPSEPTPGVLIVLWAHVVGPTSRNSVGRQNRRVEQRRRARCGGKNTMFPETCGVGSYLRRGAVSGHMLEPFHGKRKLPSSDRSPATQAGGQPRKRNPTRKSWARPQRGLYCHHLRGRARTEINPSRGVNIDARLSTRAGGRRAKYCRPQLTN